MLEKEFSKDYMHQLRGFLLEQQKQGKTIYPPGPQIFSALDSIPFELVRVVILGQDPYHGEKQAHGLCFSVPNGIKPPPSLVNIFKEINTDLGIEFGSNGHLGSWAEQGVLLLNSVLTVEKGRPASHQKKGWERFTDRIIELLNSEREGLVFLLWGSYAQKKGEHIDATRHLVLKSPHPSPLSAHRGFFGNGHFKKANDYLSSHHKVAIDWSLQQP